MKWHQPRCAGFVQSQAPSNASFVMRCGHVLSTISQCTGKIYFRTLNIHLLLAVKDGVVSKNDIVNFT